MNEPSSTLRLQYLIDFPLAEERTACARLLRQDRREAKKICRNLFREIPNFYRFLRAVLRKFGSQTMRFLWFRVWAAIETERAAGAFKTIGYLFTLRSLDDVVVDFTPRREGKEISRCFEVLNELLPTTA